MVLGGAAIIVAPFMGYRPVEVPAMLVLGAVMLVLGLAGPPR